MNEQYGGENTPVPPSAPTHDGYYILVNRVAVPCPDVRTWGQWMEDHPRHVADTTIKGCRVSTVFLGIDHAFGGGPPVVFETLVFGGRLDQEQERYGTWDEAVEGHGQMCKAVYEAEASELEQAVKQVRDETEGEE